MSEQERVAAPANTEGDWIDTLANEILGEHCACYAEAWPGHTCANEADVVAQKIRAALEAYEAAKWRPIETAPAVSINRSAGLTRHPVLTTETLWVRDADGRTYEAWFVDATDEMGRAYWWDLDAEDTCNPIEWMPHPLWIPEA